VDDDKSATNGRRTAYEKMLDDIRAGLVGAVVVWDLDRLHRRPIELEHFIDLADDSTSPWPASAATPTCPPTTAGCSPVSRAPSPALR
jgi:hypothetical protein